MSPFEVFQYILPRLERKDANDGREDPGSQEPMRHDRCHMGNFQAAFDEEIETKKIEYVFAMIVPKVIAAFRADLNKRMNLIEETPFNRRAIRIVRVLELSSR